MNIIVDVNVARFVFDPKTKEFKIYKPVLSAIASPRTKCKLLYGGTKFKNEYKHIIIKFSSLFRELRNIGKIIVLDDVVVNSLELKLKKIEPSNDFDDEHIIACTILGKCRVICTDDKRADKFIKDVRFYTSPKHRPHIYRNESHKNLITN